MFRFLLCLALILIIGSFVGWACIHMVLTIVHVVFTSLIDMIRPFVQV